MHRALLLPEVVATILQNEVSTKGFLFTALFINKLFFKEASRILWYGCGTRYGNPIYHLARIVKNDQRRAQLYADLIRMVHFAYEFSNDEYTEEAKWHEQLTRLQYPQLERVHFEDALDSVSFNRGDIIIHYAQPNVKEFRLRGGSMLSDSFLETLGQRCLRLRSVELEIHKQNYISVKGLVNFLERSQSLEIVHLREGFENSWSARAFEVISQYPRLELLSIPDVEDTWIESLAAGFPVLTSLWRFGASDRGLERMHRVAPNLTTLHLDLTNLSPSHHALASASNFSLLAMFSVKFAPGSSINGQELVLLAQNCPNLTWVQVGEEGVVHPKAFDITDNLIDELAQRLPRIQYLCLAFESSTLLTFSSLQSFAKHCQDLTRLTVPCAVDWQIMADLPEQTVFRELWLLQILLPANRIQWTEEDEDSMRFVAARIGAFAPKLTSFDLKDSNAAEERLVDFVMDICLERD